MTKDGYAIGELAVKFGLTVRTLRFYEELGFLKPANREAGGHRRYPERNVIYLKRIAQLKSYGLSLGEIKEFFALAAKDRSGTSCREHLIEKYRARIEEAEAAKREAQSRIDELTWHIDQLESGGDFFECPGRQCVDCQYGGACDMRQ
jgi:DNA-binding transcriptional MerR regulator